MEKREDPFEPVAIQARRYKDTGKVLYLVVKDQKESKLVEAESAALAVIESGYDHVQRVQRQNEIILDHMPLELLEETEEPVFTTIDLPESNMDGHMRVNQDEITDREDVPFVSMPWDAIHEKTDTGSAASE